MKYKIGDTYGLLRIVGNIQISGRNYYRCYCNCDNYTNVREDRFGKSKSCGCLSKKTQFQPKHGKTGHRLHNTWLGMKDRCYNKNCKNYDNYGGRGIIICQEWLDDFMSFYNWAYENGYSDDLTIDRINVNGIYEPSNCRWATAEQQQNNIRRNNLIDIDGEIKSLSQWSKKSGVSRQTIQRRFDKGVRGSALLEPVNRKAKYTSGIPFVKWDKSKNSWRTEYKHNDKLYFIGYVKDLDEAKRKREEFIYKLNNQIQQEDTI